MADGRTTDMAERRSAPVMRSVANGDEADEVDVEVTDEFDEEDEDEDDDGDVVGVSAVSCVVDDMMFEDDDDKAEGDLSSGGITIWYRCRADNAASRHSALMSAPTKPCVLAAANSISSSLRIKSNI
jgi:hypothetical protein